MGFLLPTLKRIELTDPRIRVQNADSDPDSSAKIAYSLEIRILLSSSKTVRKTLIVTVIVL